MKTGAGEHNPKFPSLLKNLELGRRVAFRIFRRKDRFHKEIRADWFGGAAEPQIVVLECVSLGVKMVTIVLLLPGFFFQCFIHLVEETKRGQIRKNFVLEN